MFISKATDQWRSYQGTSHENRLSEFILVRLTTKEVPLCSDRCKVRDKFRSITNRTVYRTATFQRLAMLQVRSIAFWTDPFRCCSSEYKNKHLKEHRQRRKRYKQEALSLVTTKFTHHCQSTVEVHVATYMTVSMMSWRLKEERTWGEILNVTVGERERKLKEIYDDFRYMKFIYLHCGEETNLRDSRS